MSEFRDVRNILVIILRLIGDVLLSTPVYRALRENFPDARVTALVNQETSEVLRGNPLIDKVIIFDRSMKTGSLLSRFPKEIAFIKSIRSQGFDMTISLTSGDRAAIISYFSGARYRLAYHPGKSGLAGKKFLYTHLATKRDVGHKVLQYLDLLGQFGIGTEDRSISFTVPEEAREFARKKLMEDTPSGSRKIVHIHPASRRPHKCWRNEYMADVIRWLDDQGVSVVITSSPETEDIQRTADILSLVSEKTRSRIIDLSGSTTIAELAAIAEASDSFLGVDSAPTHLASAVGTPVVAIFGAGERSWAPWGEGHTVISRHIGERTGMSRAEYIQRNIDAITPDEVKEKLRLVLERAKKLKNATS